ncbi:MAG TPA: tRNA-uridine aminocarboxypropyltransferase [Polyangiales bacterium]|jgi:DTW domain-containing protein YfiP|nr:tRNA-uridine aminocarboxypropyltransferase [Polyangiales bacterium]
MMSSVDDRARCSRCLLQQRVCLCAAIPTVVTRTRIVIVRHHLERWRSSNSGRLAHLALPNSEIVEYGGLAGDAVLPPLAGAWLVFPEGAPAQTAPVPLPQTLVVLDATWSQARRMFRKLAGLRGLPILRLPDAPMPAQRLRESPAPGRVSTIEAVARALRLIEGESSAAPLEALFAVAVARAAATGRNVAS